MTIPDGWASAQLEDGIELLSGQHILASEYTVRPPGTPYLTGPADFPDGKIIVTKYTTSPKVTCRSGDILVTIKGSGTGKIILADQEYCISRQLAAVRTKCWDSKFIFYFLQHNNSRYADAAAGLIPGIARDDILKTPIAVPPLPEQRKIASILSTWDEAIDLTAQLMAAKQRRKQALMQRLLTGKVRFPGFISSPTYQQSNFGLLPQDWEVVKLGSVMKPVSRIVPVAPQKEYKLIGVRWYGEGAHIHNTITGSDIQTPTLNHIWEGDILYNKMWTTKGAFAVAKQAHHDSYSTNEYPQFRAIDGKLDPRYFEYVFRLPRFQHDATVLCRGTTGRARLNPQDFLKLEIPMPSIEEQCKIADFIYTCTDEIDLLQQKLTALRRQKQGLMQQLLTGKVRVQV
jgi:type I restriction enzyme, S subunit